MPRRASIVSGRANQPVFRETRHTLYAFRCALFRAPVSLRAIRHPVHSSFATHRRSRVLGYSTVSIGKMFRVNGRPHARIMSALRFSFLCTALLFSLSGPVLPSAFAQQIRLHSNKGADIEIWSRGPQQKRGDLFIADGDVDIHYGDERLQADHIEYDEKTSESLARGHVRFDYNNEHLEAEEAHYNVSTGHGSFTKVHGTIKIERRANPLILISQNPLYFQAEEVERFAGDIFLVRRGWITICDPEHPTWQFYAPHARIRLNKSVALVNANFRLFRVPLVWLPYATAPAGEKVRESGFLIPIVGNSTSKGFVFGDAFYWAPRPWMDATVGAELLSRRGSAERAEFRAKPWENTSIRYSYFGVVDRGVPTVVNAGLPTQTVERVSQGGHEQRLGVQS